MTTYYMDYENGADVNAGDSFSAGHPWKTINGAIAATIAPGDVIRIAKSPAPYSIGHADWTDQSKTVTLETAQNVTVDLCETAYTAVTGLITVLNATPTNGGSGYAVNDTFYITTGGTNAIGKVTTVAATVVTGVSLLTSGNGGYTTGTGKVTSKITGGGNNALTVNITTVASAVVTRTAVATDGKEGSYCMQVACPTACKAGAKLAYYAIAPGTLAAYQKLSFWIKPSAAITAGQWRVVLCSGATGETIVDEFLIPALPAAGYWIPLTITKTGGGNLGASTASIAIYTDTVDPASASNIIVDDFIACTTAGLNLQSLISTNTNEQGGTEGWFGIQSINGVTVLLDNQNNTLRNAGRGYSGTGGHATTYARETIKTTMVASTSTVVQEVQDSGSAGSNIEFQGGYDTGTNSQTGETFFDGLNGQGYAIQLSGKTYITLNRLNGCRYWYFLYFVASANNNTITTLTSVSNVSEGVRITNSNSNTITIVNANNSNYGIRVTGTSAYNNISSFTNANSNLTHGISIDPATVNIVGTITNANNNAQYGVAFVSRYGTFGTITNANYNAIGGVQVGGVGNTIATITNANNNTSYGVYFSGYYHTVIAITNANTNGSHGVYFPANTFLNTIWSLSTTGNITAGVYNSDGANYIRSAAIAEGTVVSGASSLKNPRLYIEKQSGTNAGNWTYTDGGTINSLATDRAGGTGIMWKLAVSSSTRDIYYPLNLSIAKIACAANKLVTVKAYMKKDHATDCVGALVARVGQLTWSDGTSNVISYASTADTNWHEITITFTPTEVGVIEIEAWAYYFAANSNVYVEDMTITQAA